MFTDGNMKIVQVHDRNLKLKRKAEAEAAAAATATAAVARVDEVAAAAAAEAEAEAGAVGAAAPANAQAKAAGALNVGDKAVMVGLSPQGRFDGRAATLLKFLNDNKWEKRVSPDDGEQFYDVPVKNLKFERKATVAEKAQAQADSVTLQKERGGEGGGREGREGEGGVGCGDAGRG